MGENIDMEKRSQKPLYKNESDILLTEIIQLHENNAHVQERLQRTKQTNGIRQ